MSSLRSLLDSVAPYTPWLLGGSLLTMIATPLLTAYFIARIPPGYFLRRHAPLDGWRRTHPILRWSGLLGKNLLGFLLTLAGIAMLPLPGQGILTIVLGLMLLDFPGKRRMQLWLLRREQIMKSINWIRARRGREPLLLPERRSRSE